MTLRRSKRLAQRRARSSGCCSGSAWSSGSASSSGLSEAEESDNTDNKTPVLSCSKVSRTNNFIKV